VVGRSPEKTKAVAQSVGGQAHLADFERLDDVRRLAAELLASYEQLDVLANNAGAIFSAQTISADGHELTFQVNYLAPFLLTNLLLPRLTENPAGARVINTGSDAHKSARLDLEDLDGTRRGRSHRQAYPESKLATILFTAELARRTEGTGVTTVAFHPGLVVTDVGRDTPLIHNVLNSWLGRALLAGPSHGAQPLVHLATADDPAARNGAYFSRLTPRVPKNAQAVDPDLARQLWDQSAELTGLAMTPR
jgi:NAD(P)-dependent dehydrogenase (short-subunit alcohol dehydrogenase family)